MFKITLRAARELSGYRGNEVADHCGITEDEYRIIENDPSQTNLSLMLKISTLLALPLDLVFPGNKEGCVKFNRSQLITGNL